ncbi:MAG: DUF1080 domain-containing protein [Planctomycetes bacterium]|nr:DUF1080 domain-containing protein [Planctomycetota bacterium]MCB9871078.1 DUF1080 domain-containing protein [Planctomycetota bacterium]
MSSLRSVALCSLAVSLFTAAGTAQRQYRLHRFSKRVLAKEFTCEGASFGDLDRDGKPDLIAGPYWYAGPEFKQRHEIYPPKTFATKGYSDNFFVFVHDFDADGWNDILVIGFPGKDASWYRNPQGAAGHWKRHRVFDVVDNESPTFTDINGDGKPELVCQHGGAMGWAEVDWQAPDKPWRFHPISENKVGGRFTHGLGVGDIDGDGRKDILFRLGWWRQPESLAGDPQWELHLYNFGGRGGAQMYAYDVDGDGDTDVISSRNAHGFGLFWFEQVRNNGKITFKPHRIMGDRPHHSRYGVMFGNLHAIDLIDMDGDGLLDIVTGNRFFAHGGGDVADRGKAPLYWFQLVRAADRSNVQFVPHEIDSHSGVGTQVVAGDVNGDGYPDVVVGNKMGTFVHLHEVQKVDRETWYRERRKFLDSAAKRRDAARLDRTGGVLPKDTAGRPLNVDFETGDLRDWQATGTAFAKLPVEGDSVAKRHDFMKSGHAGRFWVGTYEPERSDRSQGTLTSKPFVVSAPFASFLIGGGKSAKSRVELVRADTGEVVFRASGHDKEDMQAVSVDLRKYQGQQVFIRLVDESSRGWGHINFDDFKLHARDPWVGGRRPLADAAERQEEGYVPAEAAKRMQVPDGFAVDVIAGEPDLHQPVAFCFDERGRLWVAEAHSYPVRAKGDEAKDKILVFEDADGDGRFEKRTLFADNLNLISGLAVGFGGVWVGAAPYLLFIPDADGDAKPDGPRQVLLDGWGYQDTHETLNSFRWGPDGWLYGCHGVFTHSKVGKPGTADAQRTKINAGVWRYQPQRHEFEVFAWGGSNQWGVDFDDHGQAFMTACVIPHLYHVVQGGRYHRQSGRHFNRHVYHDIKTIADHLHYLGAKPHAGNGVSDSVGGGHAHCGAMIYLGDAFPAGYRNAIFMNNIHGNRVNTDLLQRDGSGFVGTHGPDFLVANDKWFRGIDLRYGPDGNVYLIDWYDKQACHRTRPEIWDRTNGRLYRVRYGAEKAQHVDLRKMSDVELVALQEHDNDWYVRMGRRVLQERGGNPRIWQGLLAQLQRATEPRKQLRALWALHATGGLTEPLALQVLGMPSEHLRAWAIQLRAERREIGEAFGKKLVELAGRDPSPVVRLYLASAMQRVAEPLRWEIAEQLVRHGEDDGDHNLPSMVWYGIEPLVAKDPQRALRLYRACKLPTVRRFLCRRLAAVDGRGTQALLELFTPDLTETEARDILAEMVEALEDRDSAPMPSGWPTLAQRYRGARLPVVREHVDTLSLVFGDRSMLGRLREMAADAKLPVKRRRSAVENLLRFKDRDAVPLLHSLIGHRELGVTAIEGLDRFDHPETPGRLLTAYSGLAPDARDAVVETLLSRAAWAETMLRAVADKRLPKSVLDDAGIRRKIRHFKSAKIDELMTAAWGRSRPAPADKRKEIERYKRMLSPAVLAKADLSAGRAVFARTCMVCHKLFGTGAEIGPDITGSNRRDLDYLLENILDPSAEVAREYMLASVETKDGGFYSGLLRDETDASIVLVGSNGKPQRIAKKDLVPPEKGQPVVTRMPVSFMPEGQLLALSEAEVRDLIGYLRAEAQVPMAATETSIPHFFNGKDLAFWDADPKLWSVHDGAIVGKTATGLKQNDFAASHLLLGDFKLTFEVKLVHDAGNSGVQFRSNKHGKRSMQGYQADIGPGWWGKLYEEHGRAVLWPTSGEKHVRAGEWNTYEILAVGHRIRTSINGKPCVDLLDEKGALRGQIGLQLHAGGPTEVHFRNFRLLLSGF